MVGRSVGPRCFRQIWQKNGILKILNDLDSAGREARGEEARGEEEGGTRRKKGRGGRKEQEEGGTRRVKK